MTCVICSKLVTGACFQLRAGNISESEVGGWERGWGPAEYVHETCLTNARAQKDSEVNLGTQEDPTT